MLAGSRRLKSDSAGAAPGWHFLASPFRAHPVGRGGTIALGLRGPADAIGKAIVRRMPPASSCMTTAQPGRTSSPPRPARRLLAWHCASAARAAARAEAVVPRPVPARLDVGDCDSAPGLLGGRFRASTITCCMGTGRTEGRCDLDHAAVAWPRVAVISSLPAHALLPIVRSGNRRVGAQRRCSPIRLRKPSVGRVGQCGVFTQAHCGYDRGGQQHSIRGFAGEGKVR